MPLTARELEDILRRKLEVIHVEAIDDSDGCGSKFTVTIVSEKFEGKPLLQRHRMVNEALAEELKVIHAFSQKTLTRKEWEKLCQSK